MAAGLVEKMVTWVPGWVFKYNWAWRMAEARAARSASKTVAVTPMCRVALATSWSFTQRDATPIAGWRSSSRCQLDRSRHSFVIKRLSSPSRPGLTFLGISGTSLVATDSSPLPQTTPQVSAITLSAQTNSLRTYVSLYLHRRLVVEFSTNH